jgi:hypothetical protein
MTSEESDRDTPTVELLVKLTSAQIDLWRQAISRASTEQDAKKSARLLFKSLQATGTRYTVRELGAESVRSSHQTERRSHSGLQRCDLKRERIMNHLVENLVSIYVAVAVPVLVAVLIAILRQRR